MGYSMKNSTLCAFAPLREPFHSYMRPKENPVNPVNPVKKNIIRFQILEL